jgi:hypothetical protein
VLEAFKLAGQNKFMLSPLSRDVPMTPKG